MGQTPLTLNMIAHLTLLAATRGLQPADYVVVVIYLLAVLGVGAYFSRHREGEDYFVAGRQMPWFAVGLSLVATMLSTLTYLAFPGEVIRYGVAMAIGWMVLPLSFVVVSFMWLPFFMRFRVPIETGRTQPAAEMDPSIDFGGESLPPGFRRLTSIYEYLELRFGLVARWVGVALFTLILRFGWMAMIVLTASQAVAQITFDSAQHVLGTSLTLHNWTVSVLFSAGVLATIYTVLGGIKAVIWTDVAQFVVLFLGAVLTLIFVAVDTHTGPIEWWKTATEGAGHEFPPLWSWDLSVRNTVLLTCLHSFFWYTCTFVGDQVAMQRYFTTPTLRAAIRGNAVNFLADLAIMILLALCGMALLTYYLEFPIEIVEGVTDPRHEKVADKIFPHFIAHGLPVGVSGLVVAALFAVAMSSLDSGMNSVATVLTVDVFRRLKPGMSGREELRLARFLTVLIGLGCTLLAWPLLNIPEDYNIIGITVRTFNCALGPLATMFVVGLFLPSVGQRAVVIATCCGLAVAVAVAWWAELIWLAGWTEFAVLQEVVEHVPRPSLFLVTPLAATATFLIAAVLGALLPHADPKQSLPLTWRAVVFGEGQSGE